MRVRFLPALAAGLSLGAGLAVADELHIPKIAYPALAGHVVGQRQATPTGWKVEKAVTADLNGDGKPDLALVLKDADPHNVLDNRANLGPEMFDTNPRMLAVYFAAPGGGYDLALANHALISRATAPNMEDVLSEGGGVKIEHGLLKVALYSFSSAGSWDMGTTTYSFRWRRGRFELIGYDSDQIQRNTGEESAMSINYSTGRMITRTHNESEHSRWRDVKQTKAPTTPVLTFEAIGDGMAFDPLEPGKPGEGDET